jgi:hypothetical protein
MSNKVLLIKDNLAKWKWKGCQKCCFCDSTETVNHFFINFPFAKIIWRMMYLTYNIPPPANITNMFGRWLNGVRKDDKQKTWIGVSALCWAIWRSRNNIIFNKQSEINFLQVIRRAAHSIQQWGFLLPLEQREDKVIGCNRMLVVARNFFFQPTGWRHLNRITNA